MVSAQYGWLRHQVWECGVLSWDCGVWSAGCRRVRIHLPSNPSLYPLHPQHPLRNRRSFINLTLTLWGVHRSATMICGLYPTPHIMGWWASTLSQLHHLPFRIMSLPLRAYFLSPLNSNINRSKYPCLSTLIAISRNI